jgi:hypothetical protein
MTARSAGAPGPPYKGGALRATSLCPEHPRQERAQGSALPARPFARRRWPAGATAKALPRRLKGGGAWPSAGIKKNSRRWNPRSPRAGSAGRPPAGSGSDGLKIRNGVRSMKADRPKISRSRRPRPGTAFGPRLKPNGAAWCEPARAEPLYKRRTPTPSPARSSAPGPGFLCPRYVPGRGSELEFYRSSPSCRGVAKCFPKKNLDP